MQSAGSPFPSLASIPGILLIIVCVLAATFPASVGRGQPPSTVSPVLMEGEELVYNVRYGFINLGQVRIKTLERTRTPDYLAYAGKAQIDSYKGVPFVDLHASYESVIDSSIFSRRFLGKSKDGKLWDYARYKFEYDRNRVLVEKGHRDTLVEQRDTIAIDVPYQDGLSLFFLARDKLFSGKRMNIPTFVKEEKSNTYIYFKNKRTTVDIDAVDYPIDVVEFEGTAEFVGLFGLTGDFEGWFSNDEARVPIMAKMKVIIGSVTIELMEWNRPGWEPPKGVD